MTASKETLFLNIYIVLENDFFDKTIFINYVLYCLQSMMKWLLTLKMFGLLDLDSRLLTVSRSPSRIQSSKNTSSKFGFWYLDQKTKVLIDKLHYMEIFIDH